MRDWVVEQYSPPGDKKRLLYILEKLDEIMNPKISDRTDIEKYADKLCSLAELFYITHNREDIANCAVYMNEKTGYISSFGVIEQAQRMGVGKMLMTSVIDEAGRRGLEELELEVYVCNHAAILFYQSMGFKIKNMQERWCRMYLKCGVII